MRSLDEFWGAGLERLRNAAEADEAAKRRGAEADEAADRVVRPLRPDRNPSPTNEH